MGLAKVKFNNEEMPFTSTLDFGRSKIQVKNQTEGGHTIVQTIRNDVLSMKIATVCLASQLARYQFYNDQSSFTVTIYDALSDDPITRTVQMVNFSYSLMKDSYDLVDASQKGVYKVSFTLEEF